MQSSPGKRTTALLLMAVILVQGCAAPNARLHYFLGDQQSLSHYEDLATAIEYPVEDDPRQVDPSLFLAPRSINDLTDVKHRKVTLDECVRMAVSRAAILRDDSSFTSPGNALLANPSRVSSVYDSAIQETSFLFGNRGPEAALSDFDALFTNNMQWGRSEDPQNTPFFNLGSGQTLTEESAQWSSRIEKPFANSGTFAVQHDWNYSGNNVNQRLFQSAYTGFLQGEYRQPLLAGSGTEFTRIAGPLSQNLRGVSGVSQGVLISRINSDISLIDFEQSVTTLVRDVENRYWDLYLSLRVYDSETETFKDLFEFWQRISRRQEAGGITASALARIHEADARLKGSLADVLDAEARLRRLMGMPLSDGEFLAPADHPSEAKLTVNWEATLSEALAHRVELRRQKWEIKSLELQLRAAKNLARPRLDMVSQYRVNGFGDNLLGEEDDDGSTDAGYASAYESLTQGLNTTWNLGLSFSMPLGLRLTRAAVRHYELRLVKARAVLNHQEQEIAYELNNTLLNMDRWYGLADSSTKRLAAAIDNINQSEPRVEFLMRQDSGNAQTLLGQVLDAKISQRDAEQSYLRSIVEYNKAIVDLNFRKGVSLSNQSIYLAEGQWNPGAYDDARRRGEATSAAIDNPHLKTEPVEFVGGPASTAWESNGQPVRPHTLMGTQDLPPGSEPPVMSAPAEVPNVPSENGPEFSPMPGNGNPAPVPPASEEDDSEPNLQQQPENEPMPRKYEDRVTRLPEETASRVQQVAGPDRRGKTIGLIPKMQGMWRGAKSRSDEKTSDEVIAEGSGDRLPDVETAVGVRSSVIPQSSVVKPASGTASPNIPQMKRSAPSSSTEPKPRSRTSSNTPPLFGKSPVVPPAKVSPSVKPTRLPAVSGTGR